MLDNAKYTPRLRAVFTDTIKAALKEEFSYKNDMQIPRLDKIVLNMGVGEAVKDTKKVKQASEELSQIAGQKAVITHVEAHADFFAHNQWFGLFTGGRTPNAAAMLARHADTISEFMRDPDIEREAVERQLSRLLGRQLREPLSFTPVGDLTTDEARAVLVQHAARYGHRVEAVASAGVRFDLDVDADLGS